MREKPLPAPFTGAPPVSRAMAARSICSINRDEVGDESTVASPGQQGEGRYQTGVGRAAQTEEWE